MTFSFLFGTDPAIDECVSSYRFLVCHSNARRIKCQ
jgi:hypothetical protein